MASQCEESSYGTEEFTVSEISAILGGKGARSCSRLAGEILKIWKGSQVRRAQSQVGQVLRSI